MIFVNKKLQFNFKIYINCLTLRDVNKKIIYEGENETTTACIFSLISLCHNNAHDVLSFNKSHQHPSIQRSIHAEMNKGCFIHRIQTSAPLLYYTCFLHEYSTCS
jgi:hypothetical protein